MLINYFFESYNKIYLFYRKLTKKEFLKIMNLNLDLKNTKTLTTLVIIFLVLFAIVYVCLNKSSDGSEGFVNYPVESSDVVQLKGGLASVMDGTISVPSSINNMIQQALNTFAASLSYSKLVGIMNYSVMYPASCSGANSISSLGTIIPDSAKQPTSGLCLFNWNKPDDILYDPTSKSKMEIISSFNPNTNSITKDNIFNNNNIDKSKKHFVDLSFTMFSNPICTFNVYLLTFDDNYNVINKSTIDKIGRYCINPGLTHTSFNLKFMVPANDTMKNWGIYLFSSNGVNMVIDSSDTVSIAVYTI